MVGEAKEGEGIYVNNDVGLGGALLALDVTAARQDDRI